MLDQTGGAMNTNYVKIGPLGAYTLEAGTLTVQSSLASGVWTTGYLGAAGYITNMDNGQPYEGGVFYQSGGTVQTPAVSLGWSSVRNAPGDGLYVLLNGSLKVSDDTGGGVIASGSPTPGTMYVGTGGNGTVFQGSGPIIPTSGAITQTTAGWTYAGPGGGGTVETNSLYIGSAHSNGSTTFYGNGYYELLYGGLTVNSNTYIGTGGSTTTASSGDFTQGYSNDASNQSVVGDGTSHVTVGGDLLFGQNGGSGSYELYNGTLTVNGSGTTHPGGTNGGMYIGFGGSQGSSFTQGQPYQDVNGNWTTSSAYYDAQTSAWIPLKGGALTNSVTASNLYMGMGVPSNDNVQPSLYNLVDGNLNISGSTYIGYNGTGSGNTYIAGTFWQGLVWTGNNTSLVTPGGTFNNTGNLYLGYNSGSSGTYTLSNGTLIVGGATFIGYNGYGWFTQGLAWTASTPAVSPGGTFQTGSLYVGYGGSGGSYELSNGTLNVRDGTYIGYNAIGFFYQGLQWTLNNEGVETSSPTPGGTFNNTGNLYVGYNSGSSGYYTLANGTLNVSGTTYVGYNGYGMFNQSGGVHSAGNIIVGANGIYNYQGGMVTGALQNGGQVSVTGGTLGANNTFAATVTNNSGGTFNMNNAYVTFTNAVLNNAGATFVISQSNVTFNGSVTNIGRWITDPSTIIFKGIFTGQNGTITGSPGDTYEFLGSGTNTINLGGSTVSIGTLILGPGVTLNVTDGLLTVTTLFDPTGSNTGVTGNFIATGYGTLSSVPIPGAILLLAPGLACLVALRRRIAR
jgi:hypothetical protein